MTRRFLIFSLAVGLLALGGLNAQAGSITLADWEAMGTVDYGGLAFTFETYANATGNAPAPHVSVTFVGAGTSEVGFILNGSFSAAVGQNNDSDLVYQVSNTSITDATLYGNPAGTGTGVASVTETIRAGAYPGGLAGPLLGTLFISNTSTINPVSVTFPDTPVITVDKDINSVGGTAGVTLSQVGQSFSTTTAVPEPASMALLGIGLSGLFTLRRLFRRTSVA